VSGIVGILLAAGFSRRFGGDKRLQPLADGRPMAAVAAANLLAACGRVIAVVRPEDKALADALDELGCTVAAAEDAALGMGHSLAAGVAASGQARGWLIALADMPRIEAASYQAVLAALQGGAAMARPEYGGRPGHPVGFAEMWRAELLGLQGDSGARAILQSAPGRVVACPVDDAGVLFDVDTPRDLA